MQLTCGDGGPGWKGYGVGSGVYRFYREANTETQAETTEVNERWPAAVRQMKAESEDQEHFSSFAKLQLYCFILQAWNIHPSVSTMPSWTFLFSPPPHGPHPS